jgi:hypothetical protein
MKIQHESKFKIYKELKLVLQNSENLSVQTAEEINSHIESLDVCIQNNAEGLKKAMKDMELLTDQ